MSLRKALGVLFFLAAPLAAAASAQSGSTDVMPTGAHYVEFSFASHMEPWQDGGYQTYAARYIQGMRHNTELGMNLEATKPRVPDQGLELQPNAKWQFYLDERRGVSASVGTILYLPVYKRQGTDTFVSVYASASKTFAKARGLRLTGGGYALLGRDPQYGARYRPLFGVAQPITRKVSIGTDWVVGANRYGFVTPGISISLSPRTTLTIGYAIGNEGRKNNELGAAYGFTY